MDAAAAHVLTGCGRRRPGSDDLYASSHDFRDWCHAQWTGNNGARRRHDCVGRQPSRARGIPMCLTRLRDPRQGSEGDWGLTRKSPLAAGVFAQCPEASPRQPAPCPSKESARAAKRASTGIAVSSNDACFHRLRKPVWFDTGDRGATRRHAPIVGFSAGAAPCLIPRRSRSSPLDR